MFTIPITYWSIALSNMQCNYAIVMIVSVTVVCFRNYSQPHLIFGSIVGAFSFINPNFLFFLKRWVASHCWWVDNNRAKQYSFIYSQSMQFHFDLGLMFILITSTYIGKCWENRDYLWPGLKNETTKTFSFKVTTHNSQNHIIRSLKVINNRPLVTDQVSRMRVLICLLNFWQQLSKKVIIMKLYYFEEKIIDQILTCLSVSWFWTSFCKWKILLDTNKA